MATLTLSLLGTFQVRLNGAPVDSFHSDKVRALLVYLAVESSRSHRRRQLAGLLWPDWPDRTARSYLRHALANLRQILGDRGARDPFLLTTRDVLQFNQNSDAQIDVVALQADLDKACLVDERISAAAIQHIEHGIACYHGPFWEGFGLDGCVAFEEWLLLTRERLHRQVLQGLYRLGDHYEQLGQYARALPLAWRRVELEPWLEEAHQQVMRLLALSGRRTEALHQYEVCRNLLAEELGVDPNEETQSLYRHLLNGSEDMLVGRYGDTGKPYSVIDPQAMQLKPNRNSDNVPKRAFPVPLHNLPAQLTHLIGRSEDVAAVCRLFRLEDARLVTLAGLGGVGKTRLALAVAHELLADFADGAIFLPLTQIQDASLLPVALAQALAIRHDSGRPLLEYVQAQLLTAKTLLILDNFEHVLAGASVLSELLAGCPRLKILVTSRTLLRLRGEYEYMVQPLHVPDKENEISKRDLVTFSSVELFRQQAVAVQPEFSLNDENILAVAQICRHLDGLPLAIELAAARLKHFSPDGLLQHLNGRKGTPLDFLRTVKRDAPSRHRSLWDTITWSYDLLEPEVQMLFRRMAVFTGGFTVEAVAAVCVESEEIAIWDVISLLIDQHLVQLQEHCADELRFEMLETLRAFGLERMRAHGEMVNVQYRHGQYFLSLVEEANRHLSSDDQDNWLALLDIEHSNIRSVLHWATTTPVIEIALRLGAALPHYWLRRGLLQEAYGWFVPLLDLCVSQAPVSPCESIAFHAGMFAAIHNDLDAAQAHFAWSADLCRKLGNRRQLSFPLALLGDMAYNRGDYVTWEKLHEESLQLANEASDLWQVAMLFSHKGRQMAMLGKLAQGREFCEQGLALHQQQGDKWGTCIALYSLGVVSRLQTRLDEARTIFEKGLHLSQELNEDRSTARALLNLGMVWVDLDDPARARPCMISALRYYDQIWSKTGIASALNGLVQLAALQCRPRRVLRLAGAASALRTSLGEQLPPLYQVELDRSLNLALHSLGEAACIEAWAVGESMTMAEVVAYALTEE